MSELLTRERCIRVNTGEISEISGDRKSASKNSAYSEAVNAFIKETGIREENLVHFSQKILSCLAKKMEISQGMFFIAEKNNGRDILKFLSGFACKNPEQNEEILEFGDGFTGQVAKDGKLMNITDVPEGYISIESGLGKATPRSLLIFPVKQNENVLAVVELASFHTFTHEDELFLEELSHFIADQIL